MEEKNIQTSENAEEISKEKAPAAEQEEIIQEATAASESSDNPKDQEVDRPDAGDLDEPEESGPELTIESLANAIDELSGKVDQMNQLFIQKIQHTTHEEKIVDQMHSELQRYKEDMYAQLVRPILLDVIGVRDSILQMSAGISAKPEEEQTVPLKTFSSYAFDLQDILEKNNITIYKCNEGDAFTPVKQRVVKKVETSEEQLHGKVAESLSSGYAYMGKTISPEKVAVYVYKKTEETEGEH